jgi:predicted Zn-dependent protease
LQRAGWFDEAAEALDRLDHADPSIRLELVTNAIGLRHFDEARRLASDALKDPHTSKADQVVYQIQLAITDEEAGKHKEAEQALEAVLARVETQPLAAFALARCLLDHHQDLKRVESLIAKPLRSSTDNVLWRDSRRSRISPTTSIWHVTGSSLSAWGTPGPPPVI